MAYSEKVLDHYEHPRNVGTLDKDAPNVGTGRFRLMTTASSKMPNSRPTDADQPLLQVHW